MAQCVAVDPGTGAVTATSDDPCLTFLLVSPAEFASFTASPFALSAEDGMALAVAILTVWGAAFAVRALVRALNTDGEVNESQ